jgi:hypothetical protein
MSGPDATPSAVGFLTILRDGPGYLGGYLVTNLWGRPLEFRLSSAVQPNRVQQLLYGASLEPYLCGELIGKTLVEKTATAVQLVLTDHAAALELRRHTSVLVALLRTGERGLAAHSDFADDAASIRRISERLGSLDLAEPFSRIREAIAEARKLGVGGPGRIAA